MNFKHKLLLALLVLSGSFLISEKASADSVYSGCDFVGALEQNYTPDFSCGSNLPEALTLYGFTVHEFTLGGVVAYVQYEDLNGGSSTCVRVATTTIEAGSEHTFVFETPIAWASGSKPMLHLKTSSTCATGTTTARGSIANGRGNFTTYWSQATLEATQSQFTAIISVDPISNETVATGTRSVTVIYRLDDLDYDDTRYLFSIYKISATSSTPIYQTTHGSDAPNATIGTNSTSSPSYNFSEGRYSVVFSLCNLSGFWVFSACETPLLAGTTTYFTVGSTSAYTNAQVTIQNKLDALFGSTTLNITENCNPLGGFDMGNCLMGVFYPGQEVFEEDLLLLKQLPPWGYVFRFYDIVTSEASTSIPIFSAVIPPTLPGAGSTISLSFNNVLDDVLNATSGVFISGSATSTETFYEITSKYWNIMVFIGLGLYLMKRLLGNKLISGMGHKQIT